MLTLSIYPLPLVTHSHDASVAVLSGSKILFAYEEEKVARVQHAIARFPEFASLQAFKECAIHPTEIEQLVVTSIDSCASQPEFGSKIDYIKRLLSLSDNVAVQCVPHHLAHSSLAVLTSPFDRCIFLTMDGGGDSAMGHWGVFDGQEFKIQEIFQYSPAIVYSCLSSLAGFGLYEEGKLMGLSAYGKIDERLRDWLRANFWIAPGSGVLCCSSQMQLVWGLDVDPARFDLDTLRRHKYLKVMPYFSDGGDTSWMTEIPAYDIAATAQRFFEDLVVTAVRNIIERTGLKNVAVSGGAFQNVLLNGRLQAIPGISVHVPLAPHDAGLVIGAGLFVAHQKKRSRPSAMTPYLGPRHDSFSIEKTLEAFGLKTAQPIDLYAVVADRLATGKVVGWFQGRAEFGPRALGGRSVLADPRSLRSKARVNQALKKRDWFMPYAPSILEEYGSDFFENFTPSPFMNRAFRVKPEKAELIPAGVHIDGTCRVQTVRRELSPEYYELIEKFGEFTGIPLVLNTSFNRHGIPILATPRQAIHHLLEGNVDCLCIGKFLVDGPAVVKSDVNVESEVMCLCLDTLCFSARLVSRQRHEKANRILRRIQPVVTASSNGLICDGIQFWEMSEDIGTIRARWYEIVRSKEIHFETGACCREK